MKLTVEIASVPDRENVVAEIWLKGEMIAEVVVDDIDVFVVDVYPKPNGGVWTVDLEDLIQALSIAKTRLAE